MLLAYDIMIQEGVLTPFTLILPILQQLIRGSRTVVMTSSSLIEIM